MGIGKFVSLVFAGALALLVPAFWDAGAVADVVQDRGPAPKDRFSEALVVAAHKGQLEAAKEALQHKPDLEFVRNYGPALYEAARQGHLELVRLLLEHGAKIDSRGGFQGWSALHGAAGDEHPEIVRLLLQNRASTEVRNSSDNTPLMLATVSCNLEIIKLLLDGGAQIDARTKGGLTALFMAVSWKRPACVTELVRRGASTTVTVRYMHDNVGDFTPLRGAASLGHTEVVTALLAAGAEPNLAGPDGRTALAWAAERGHADTVAALLAGKAEPDRPDIDGVTPLLRAARGSDVQSAQALLAAGADPTRTAKDGSRALEPLRKLAMSAPELKKPLEKYAAIKPERAQARASGQVSTR